MRKFLIVVDMLNDFINQYGLLYCGPTASAIVPYVKARVDEYREAGLSIIFLCDDHAKDDKEFERFPKHAVEGTEGSLIIKELGSYGAKNKEYTVKKARYSGFYDTNLDNVLMTAGLSAENSIVEVCGVCTNICVMDTVGDLANRDYATVVHRNCVADFDPEMHEMALKRMNVLYGTEII